MAPPMCARLAPHSCYAMRPDDAFPMNSLFGGEMEVSHDAVGPRRGRHSRGKLRLHPSQGVDFFIASPRTISRSMNHEEIIEQYVRKGVALYRFEQISMTSHSFVGHLHGNGWRPSTMKLIGSTLRCR